MNRKEAHLHHIFDVRVQCKYNTWLKEDCEPFTPSCDEGFKQGFIEGKNDWIKIDPFHPLPKFEEVLAFNKEWIEADWNPKGVRIGYLTDEGSFISAYYCPDPEDYGNRREEGDDFDYSQEQEDGSLKTWYNNGDERGDIEGHRPNMPTHFMRISSPIYKLKI